MNILVNGETRELPEPQNLQQLIDDLALGDKRLAVELNEQIVPRSRFDQTTLQNGDVVEIVHAIGGG